MNRPPPTIYHPDTGNDLGLVREVLHLILREVRELRTDVRELKESAMAAIDDVNAKLDEIQAKVTKIGADLAAEVALLQQSGGGGLTADQVTALQGRLQTISDNLTAVDVTAPPATASPSRA